MTTKLTQEILTKEIVFMENIVLNLVAPISISRALLQAMEDNIVDLSKTINDYKAKV